MRRPKLLLHAPRSAHHAQARTVGISLYPSHRQTLAAAEQRYNLTSSFLVQMLIELSERDGLLDQEVNRRVTGAAAAELKNRKTVLS